MEYIRKSEDRGIADLAWLQSKHTFSFGNYYDPRHMGVSVLRVINDDTVMPGKGFAEHGHRDMEIISYVTEGTLKHNDSTGNSYVLPAGEVQLMSAGSGIRHSEFNASEAEKVKFLQIWIEPNKKGIQPSYEQKKLPQKGPLTTLASPIPSDDTLLIHQDATLSRLILKKDESITLQAKDRIGYLHLIKGQIVANEETFDPGDAFAIKSGKELHIKANADIEALWFDLPKLN